MTSPVEIGAAAMYGTETPTSHELADIETALTAIREAGWRIVRTENVKPVMVERTWRIGRPAKHGDRISTAIRFDPAVHKRLVAAAEERDLSVNWLVNRAVADFLDRLLPLDEIVLTRPQENHRG